ncbi:nucleoside triphosphate pyrophosphohydrolase [Methylobacterium frigidaeris]|uniref:Nucleoside triphosphate pyrophosphohydrolase n=1 Tax=Methylobacterium frigidaeris TaxID=2038277 RepID=A0AA37HCQ3_9HYPH|nr:nucleoside triphosphate pyrophosphohydrolase [Methylobacterium frigidaeris]PIK70287.1 nucleoside triphosphate pyrophosphohydrolase [Methylobacterium frigidaeris]GJD63558.1 Nucleoside triphosphate pyrophosphohydrolase [Methylobacterium frigidaeris]
MSTPPIARLLGIMARLRDPEGGCPWDLAQTHASIVPYTIEEAYEVAEAVEGGDPEELRDELGDLLFQVVFQSRIAEEAGTFAFDDVATAIADKMVRRHPHIFGEVRGLDPDAVNAQWAAIKAEERAAKAERDKARSGRSEPQGTLAGVPLALPALARAERISRKAASVGFDWPDAAEVIAKVREETDEVAQALAGEGPEAVAEEIGDLLFSVANLARHAGVDPEEALRRANLKFQRRFAAMETEVTKDGRSLPEAGLAAMEAAWVAVKRREG